MSNTTDNTSDPITALKKYFNYDSFRPGQESIVKRILAGEDLFVVMPTSAGKSLCFQLPILMKAGYGMVISPLISLMKDQVDKLHAKKIPAAFINSQLSSEEQQSVMNSIAEGKLKILYVAPERLGSASFLSFLENCPPSMLIVDEAHGISQYGHDFRPAYLRIGEAMRRLPGIQTCAFTATVTPVAREDVKVHLLRPDMKVIITGFSRPNLSFSVIRCDTTSDKDHELSRLLKRKVPTIVYASTRSCVEKLAAQYHAAFYHGDMKDLDRSDIQERFVSGSCGLLFATCAFGMGVDRPDVRRVIHYNVPGSVEAYFQEAGRAGRDGQPADCILLHCPQDFHLQRLRVDWSNPTPSFIKRLYFDLFNIAKRSGKIDFEWTLEEFKARLPWASSKDQIGAALNILERLHYVTRLNVNMNPGTLTFLRKIPDLYAEHLHGTTLKSRFITGCIGGFADKDLEQGARCSYDKLVQHTGMELDQIKRIIHALDGDIISWIPPFFGRTTRLLLHFPDGTIRGVDWEPLWAKRERDFKRLDAMSDYVGDKKTCRQRRIMDYFGDSSVNWTCGVCDVCKPDRVKQIAERRRTSDLAMMKYGNYC